MYFRHYTGQCRPGRVRGHLVKEWRSDGAKRQAQRQPARLFECHEDGAAFHARHELGAVGQSVLYAWRCHSGLQFGCLI